MHQKLQPTRLPLAIAAAITLVACQAAPVTNPKAPDGSTVNTHVSLGNGATAPNGPTPANANAGNAGQPGANGQTAPGQQPAGGQGPNGPAIGTGTNGQPDGTAVAGSGSVPKADAALTREQALAAAKPMAITAAQGGRYVSADGSLVVDIPPGALSKDATVRFTPVDTSTIPSNQTATPGIMFAADFGGASIADNATVVVKSKVDARLIADAKSHIPDFKPDTFNLTQDASGQWMMAMPIHGDYTNGQAAPAAPSGNSWALQEFGPNAGARAQQAPPSQHRVLFDVASTGTPTPAPTPTATPTPAPTPTPCTLEPIAADYAVIDNLPAMPCGQEANYPYIPSTTWWSGQVVKFVDDPFEPSAHAAQKIHQVVADTKASWGEFFICLGFWHTDCLGTVDDALYAVETYNQAVAHHRQPTDQMKATAFSYYKVNGNTVTNCNYTDLRNMVVNMQFDSDDPAAAGPITNGTVTFGSGAASISVGTDTNGSASQAFYPTTVAYSASWPNPNGLTAAPIANAYSSSTRIVANNTATYHINLVWHKYSPTFEITMDSADGDINEPQVTYNLDGTEHTATSADYVATSGLGTHHAVVTFRAKVGDDLATHAFKLEKVSAGGLVTVDASMPAGVNVQRTKSYPYAVQLFNITQK